MPDGSTFALFALASIALLVVPGPTVLYVVARSVEGGRRAGVASAVGAHVGTLVHVAAAALGVSALVVSSATAYSAVKYAGAAYLVLLGLRRLLDRRSLDLAGPEAGAFARSTRALLLHGAVVNVLNPKTALFFLAFLPQFVDVGAGQVVLQIVVLGLVFIALGLLSDSAYALVAGSVAARLRRSRRALAAERYVSASVYLGLGAAAAVSGEKAPAAASAR
jgi:threonine/homoserine/homoserine lactone efflux protein